MEEKSTCGRGSQAESQTNMCTTCGHSRSTSFLLQRIYRCIKSESFRSRLRRWILAIEGGPARSPTIRAIYRDLYGVEVGMYSTAPFAMKPGVLHRGTVIGRYSTVADTVRTFTRSHPMDTISTHGVFYNPSVGVVQGGAVEFGRLEIGHGVTIGHHAIILPPTKHIGDGAVIEAGSVVYDDVPPYALVSGSPAFVMGRRYAAEVIDLLSASRWWEETPDRVIARTEAITGQQPRSAA